MREQDKSFQHVIPTNTPITHLLIHQLLTNTKLCSISITCPPQNYNFCYKKREKESSHQTQHEPFSGTFFYFCQLGGAWRHSMSRARELEPTTYGWAELLRTQDQPGCHLRGHLSVEHEAGQDVVVNWITQLIQKVPVWPNPSHQSQNEVSKIANMANLPAFTSLSFNSFMDFSSFTKPKGLKIGPPG